TRPGYVTTIFVSAFFASSAVFSYTLYADGLEMLARGLFDILVQAVAVRVHRDDRREVLDLEVPHLFRRADLEQRHFIVLLDRPGVELRCAADGIQVHRSVLLQRGQRLRAH